MKAKIWKEMKREEKNWEKEGRNNYVKQGSAPVFQKTDR